MPFAYIDADRPECDIRPGDFDGRPPIFSRIIEGDPTYAYRPMPPLSERFPPVRKKKPEARAAGEIFAAPRPQPAASFTYLMGAEGSNFVKIGWARDPESRVAALQTGNPMTLSILWKVEGPYEARLHTEFAPYRVRGEWFDLTPLGDPVEAVKVAVERIKASEDQ